MMKRLLCIVGCMDMGGAETFLMKIYRSLDRSKYQMDFCVSSKKKGYYDDEIESLGGKIYHTTPKSRNPFKSFKSIYSIVKKNNYKYVMRASQNSLSSLELLAAKMAGAKVRVFRSTNSKTMKGGVENVVHFVFKPLVRSVANVKIAPSKPAAKFMFGNSKKTILLNNGIPLSDFAYDESFNKRKRKELGIDKKTFVVGHVGRFNTQKNHERIIDIFCEILKKRPDSKLVLIGKGELEKQVKEKIDSLGIGDNVLMLGAQSNVNKMLSVFDLLLFPSLYEGMPNVIIEAQANGVPCVISDTITDEAKICDNVYMVGLDKSNKEWCDVCLGSVKRISSKDSIELLNDNGYNIDEVVKAFVDNVYEKKMKK